MLIAGIPWITSSIFSKQRNISIGQEIADCLCILHQLYLTITAEKANCSILGGFQPGMLRSLFHLGMVFPEYKASMYCMI